MTVAFAMALRSPDRSTKVGAVIAAPDNTIVATGYNGWPRGVVPFTDDDPRWNRPEKYFWMAHAERNAMDNAARTGVSVKDCSLYCLIMPCADCSRGIVQVGIKRVVVYKPAMDAFAESMNDSQEWVKGLDAAKRMFEEAGVEIGYYDGPIEMSQITLAGSPYMLKQAKTGLLGAIGPVGADVVRPSSSD